MFRGEDKEELNIIISSCKVVKLMWVMKERVSVGRVRNRGFVFVRGLG